MTDESLDWAYLAGLVDGEGCITINHNKSERYYSGLLTIGMVDEDIVRWCHKFTGFGCIYKHTGKGNCQDSFIWTVRTRQAAVVLEKLLPYLRVKKLQALIVLELQKHIYQNRPGYRRPLSSEELAYRHSLYLKIRSLHTKGVKICQMIP